MTDATIDLNADLGEGMAGDADLLAVVSSCSVACGGHAGDAVSMARTLRAARAANVAAGAHPSYPDREGFGRVSLDLDKASLRAALTTQVAALRGVAARESATLVHLKPHGALYNDAARRGDLAALIATLTAELLPGAALIGPPSSALEDAARARGVRFLAEGFADRAYRADGTLVPRAEPGAVIGGAERPARAVRLATTGALEAVTGEIVSLPVGTICLHGDSPDAGAAARAVRAALEAAGVTVAAPLA